MHQRRRLEIVPETWTGKGQVLYVLFLWLMWKFFFGMIKHVIIILLLGGVFAGAYYFFRTPSSPAKNPAIGKHAYLTE